MRVLCVCHGGNVRSAALATRLKQRYRIDALACGILKNHRDTVLMLCRWADVIVAMSREVESDLDLPTEFAHKLQLCDVGPDRFGSPTHPELTALVKPYAASLAQHAERI